MIESRPELGLRQRSRGKSLPPAVLSGFFRVLANDVLRRSLLYICELQALGEKQCAPGHQAWVPDTVPTTTSIAATYALC